MLKDVYRANGPKGLTYSVRTLLGWLSDTSLAGLEVKHAELYDKVTKFLGRPPSEREFVDGIAKTAPLREQVNEARRAKARQDYARRLEAEAAYDPTQDRLRTAQSRAEEERRAGLSAAQRELEDATRDAEAAKQHRIDKAKRAELRQTGTYKQLRSALDDLILISKLSADVTAEQVALIEAESHSLEKHVDLAATRQNLAQLQKVVAGSLEVQDVQLREAVDRSEMRKKMLAAGQTWDSIDTELVGDLPFVVLTVGDRTVKISQSKFDARTSDENLRSELFGGGESNV